jgi:hypothetical protein
MLPAVHNAYGKGLRPKADVAVRNKLRPYNELSQRIRAKKSGR